MGVATPLKLTYEDYLYFPEDGKRHELIDGEHYVTPAPTPKHQFVLLNLIRSLDAWIREHGRGRLGMAPMDVVLSEVDVVQPDLLYFAPDRLDRIGEARIDGAPSLVVEILSDGTRKRDEITKRHLYSRHGVEEYWIVDPLVETVKVFRPGDDGALVKVAELSGEGGDELASPLFPGLSIPLAAIFSL